MPRPKEIRIPVKELSARVALKEELSKLDSLADYDIDRAVLVMPKRKPPVFIKDVDRAIKNLERYVHINRELIPMFEDIQLINKKDLARMLKISRPTLDKWIENGFVYTTPTRIPNFEIFQTDTVLQQLKEYKRRVGQKITMSEKK